MNLIEAIVARLADGPAYVSAPLHTGQRALVRRIFDAMPVRPGAAAARTARSHIRLQADTDMGKPYRWPHHTCSHAGLVGGRNQGSSDGVGPRWLPGEVHLACGGLLVLDECEERSLSALAVTADELASMAPEFRPWVLLLDTVRQPGTSDVRRVKRSMAMLHKFGAWAFAPSEAEWRQTLLAVAR